MKGLKSIMFSGLFSKCCVWENIQGERGLKRKKTHKKKSKLGHVMLKQQCLEGGGELCVCLSVCVSEKGVAVENLAAPNLLHLQSSSSVGGGGAGGQLSQLSHIFNRFHGT